MLPVILIALAVVALWLLWAFLPSILPHVGLYWQIEELGHWGDSFSALSALFAALGFIAVIATLRQQQQQIKAAEDEQNRQRFASTYFELLRLLREARNDVRFRYSREYAKKNQQSREERRGAAAFRAASYEALSLLGGNSVNLSKEQVGEIYQKNVHARFESNFGPYFRLLYTILERIKVERSLSASERVRYGNLLRSQLTSYEITLAGLNGLSPVSKDFSTLVTEFHLLKYLPEGLRRRVLQRY
jgi:hypothetical protein